MEMKLEFSHFFEKILEKSGCLLPLIFAITFLFFFQYFNIEYSIWVGIYSSGTAQWAPERSINAKPNQPIRMIHNQSALTE